MDADLFKKYMIVGISSHLDREHIIDQFYLDRELVDFMPPHTQELLRCILSGIHIRTEQFDEIWDQNNSTDLNDKNYDANSQENKFS